MGLQPVAVAPVTLVLGTRSRDLFGIGDFFDDEFGPKNMLIVGHRRILSKARYSGK
jgi:hypothetical protein